MKEISNVRIFLIAVITLLSIWGAAPTARYYMHLRHQPELTAPRPSTATIAPEDIESPEYIAWLNANPKYKAWAETHSDYIEWENRSEQLRSEGFLGMSPIPLGLDLRGGVDVTLKIDYNKALVEKLERRTESLRRYFENEQVAVELKAIDQGRRVSVAVLSESDTRAAANILREYNDIFVGDYDEAALKAGTASFTLSETTVASSLKQDLEGARKAIAERVDSMGVTQPKVSLQGDEYVRIQVPGEKNPDRLITNVIRPAFLELKLVHPENERIIREAVGPDGELDRAYVLPAGTEFLPTKFVSIDVKTKEEVVQRGWMVVSRSASVTGKNLINAQMNIDPTQLPDPVYVSLEFDQEGTQKFAEVTSANVGRRLAIVLDGTVRSAPNLKTAITDGRCIISGGFQPEEAKELSDVLKAGSLPAPLIIENKHTVGASLGKDSILSGVKALLIGSVAIVVFMIAYYGMAGVIAIIALIMNILLILLIMSLSNATLTLSGIGGILLTLGMASDANVLIYERIREEIEAGRPLRQAIGLGFNRAFTVILDSNLTTLLTALVLLQFTEGSVFGFALTMVFGLLANFYTGLTVTYTLCALWFQKRQQLSLGVLKFPKTNIPFISMRKISWSISAVVFVVGVLLLFSRGGVQMGVDFAGGARAEVHFTEDVQSEQLRTVLSDNGIENPRVQAIVDKPNTFIIDSKTIELPAEMQGEISEVGYTEQMLRAALTAGFTEAGYTVDSFSSFGAETSRSFGQLALVVVVLASLAILAYLWFRFEIAFGVAAVIALIHDLLVVVVVSEVWGVQITLEVVAALLVLLGFSVNDTIVIFDRIRENTRTMARDSFESICNSAMNQSLSRTVVTSLTTLFAVACLLIFGGEGLSNFAKVLFTGVIVGTYSSDFLAAPLVFQWNKFKGNQLQKSLAEKKKIRSEAKPVRSAGAATRTDK